MSCRASEFVTAGTNLWVGLSCSIVDPSMQDAVGLSASRATFSPEGFAAVGLPQPPPAPLPPPSSPPLPIVDDSQEVVNGAADGAGDIGLDHLSQLSNIRPIAATSNQNPYLPPPLSQAECSRGAPALPPFVWRDARASAHGQILGAGHSARAVASATAAALPQYVGTGPLAGSSGPSNLLKGVTDIIVAAVAATISLVDGKPADTQLIASEALKRLTGDAIMHGVPTDCNATEEGMDSGSDSDVENETDNTQVGYGTDPGSNAPKRSGNVIAASSVLEAVDLVISDSQVNRQAAEVVQQATEAHLVTTPPIVGGLTSAEDLLLQRGFGVSDDDRKLLRHQQGWTHDSASGSTQQDFGVITSTHLPDKIIATWWEVIDRGPRRTAVAEQAHQLGPVSMHGRRQLHEHIGEVDVPRMLTAAKELELQMRVGKNGLQLALWANRYEVRIVVISMDACNYTINHLQVACNFH